MFAYIVYLNLFIVRERVIDVQSNPITTFLELNIIKTCKSKGHFSVNFIFLALSPSKCVEI